MDLLLEYFAKGLITMLTIAMPCVLTAAGVGLVVGILQAVTQVQEQTIAAAPKIFSVFLVIIIMGTGYLQMLTNIFNEGAVIAFDTIPKTEPFVLPPDYYHYTKPFIDEMKTDVQKDMTPMSHILRNVAHPNSSAQKEHFSFLRNGATNVPTPNLAEQKKINENRRN